MVTAVYIDIHIHTSENPDKPNESYNVDLLIQGIQRMSQGNESLISLTDHNMLNKDAYKKLLSKAPSTIHVLLGVELHIKNYSEAPAYHCHMIFNCDVTDNNIDRINESLNKLYHKKQVKRLDKDLPSLQDVINEFDSYEFVLLPHGGQSHATFNESIPSGTKFDTTLMRSIYYNQFDGFTARCNEKLEETENYFKRLGIAEFVNLVTCSDNYYPDRYPDAKAADAKPFLPTWMFAEPTFDGLRLSLSENTRFKYCKDKPIAWSEYIKSAKLKNDKIDIDVTFTPGLNVIIGGSSSGKTLLVDSMNRKLCHESFDKSDYSNFDVVNINIDNPSSTRPHYIKQNYIIKLLDMDSEKGIENIDIIKNVFPENSELKDKINEGISKLRYDVANLMRCVEEINDLANDLRRVPSIGRLLINGEVKKNLFDSIIPTSEERLHLQYSKTKYEKHIEILDEISEIFHKNPLSDNMVSEIFKIKTELTKLCKISVVEENIYNKICCARDDYRRELLNESQEDQQKSNYKKNLIEYIKRYVQLKSYFNKILSDIANYNITIETRDIQSMGHHLYLENNFKLSKEKVLEVFNLCLLSQYQIKDFSNITAETLQLNKYKGRGPKIDSYDDVVEFVVKKFVEQSKTRYKIKTSDGRNFDDLSAGWKTSVLLDIILDYDKDMVPVIIDQPEDNLASSYINTGLVCAIKKTKVQKQIILVSHNATIPMLADAQNIVYCKTDDVNHKIVIRSAPLEGRIDGIPVLDLIAKITDGGKASIKKRVKKYNLKKYTES